MALSIKSTPASSSDVLKNPVQTQSPLQSGVAGFVVTASADGLTCDWKEQVGYANVVSTVTTSPQTILSDFTIDSTKSLEVGHIYMMDGTDTDNTSLYIENGAENSVRINPGFIRVVGPDSTTNIYSDYQKLVFKLGNMEDDAAKASFVADEFGGMTLKLENLTGDAADAIKIDGSGDLHIVPHIIMDGGLSSPQSISVTGGFSATSLGVTLPTFTVATLPSGAVTGAIAYCSNARNAGEGAGAGTGSLVSRSATGVWRIPGIATAVQA